MPKIYFFPDGTPSPNPTSYDTAIDHGKPRYDDGLKCPECEACSIKYTATKTCIHCARLTAMAYHNTLVAREPWPADRQHSEDMERAARVLGFDLDSEAVLAGNPQRAAALGDSFYIRLEACRTHGHPGLTRVEDGDCWFCHERKQNRRARSEARKAGSTYYTPAVACAECGTHADRRVSDDRCLGCRPLLRISDEERASARRKGWTYYQPSEPCPECGEHAKRRVSDNRCRGCSPMGRDKSSPRQEAIARGEKWYKPIDPCPRCNTTAMRRVADGRCSECAGIDTQPSADAVMMEQCPDMVLTRKEARLADLSVYRTGKPCKRGHTGWRYVSTGACIDCMRS